MNLAALCTYHRALGINLCDRGAPAATIDSRIDKPSRLMMGLSHLQPQALPLRHNRKLGSALTSISYDIGLSFVILMLAYVTFFLGHKHSPQSHRPQRALPKVRQRNLMKLRITTLYTELQQPSFRAQASKGKKSVLF